MAVRVRLKKSNYFFEGGSCSTASWDEILSWGVRACPPPSCDTKPWFCVAGGGGLAPPCPRRKFQVCHIVNLHYTKPWFCVAGEGGLAPPLLRRKTTVLRRKWGGARNLDRKIGFRHQRHARSSRLAGSASFDEIKRLRWVWTQY